MARKIAWTDQSKADVRAIDQSTAMRILHGLARFTLVEEGDVKQLQDIEPPEFRLRIGAFRVPSLPPTQADAIEIQMREAFIKMASDPIFSPCQLS
jgi:hypothetical protein